MEINRKILLINGHQYYPSSEGKLNQSLMDFAQHIFEEHHFDVQTTNIEKRYDIQEEAKKHEWADLVITQTPVYWFAGPWIYKKYIDEVFGVIIRNQKLAISDGRSRSNDHPYGSGGTNHGKKFLLSSTWNAPEVAFSNSSQFLFQGKSLDDALIGITSVYKFCGFEILPGFACFDVKKNPQIETDMKRYEERLLELIPTLKN